MPPWVRSCKLSDESLFFWSSPPPANHESASLLGPEVAPGMSWWTNNTTLSWPFSTSILPHCSYLCNPIAEFAMSHSCSNLFIPNILEDLFNPDCIPIPVSELTTHYIVHSLDPALGLPHILCLLSLHQDEPLHSVDIKVNIKLVPISSRQEPSIYCMEKKEGPIPVVWDLWYCWLNNWV